MKKTLERPGKSKEELLKSLQNLKESYKNKISGNDIEVTEITDGFKVRAEKRFIVKFYVEAEITAREGAYDISWETNAPQSKVDEALKGIEQYL